MITRRGFLARMLCAAAVVPVMGPFSMVSERPAMIAGARLRDPHWIADLIFNAQTRTLGEFAPDAWVEDAWVEFAIDFERSSFRDEETRRAYVESEARRHGTWTAFKTPLGTKVDAVEFLDPHSDHSDQKVVIEEDRQSKGSLAFKRRFTAGTTRLGGGWVHRL